VRQQGGSVNHADFLTCPLSIPATPFRHRAAQTTCFAALLVPEKIIHNVSHPATGNGCILTKKGSMTGDAV
jgi:hypothetical protein